MKCEKNVRMQNCSLQQDLEILPGTFPDQMYVIRLNLKTYGLNF